VQREDPAPPEQAPDLDPLRVLARAADACVRGTPATIALGLIQPGTVLELRLLPGATQEARA
jgi:hypothetical protein